MHLNHAGSLVLVLILFLGRASSVQACICEGGSVEEYVGWTDEVFIGRVDTIAVPRLQAGPVTFAMINREQRVTFTTEQWWKGKRSRTLTAWAGSGGEGSCGTEFTVGERYLVFGRVMEDGALQIGGCSATPNVSDATVLSALGPSLEPLPDIGPAPWEESATPPSSAGETPPARSSTSLVWAVPALLLSLGLGVALGRYTRRAA